MLIVTRAKPAYHGDSPHWRVTLSADDRHDAFQTVLHSEHHQGRTYYYNDHDAYEAKSLWRQVEHVLHYFA
jgi:hypothetical protein